MVTKYIEVPVDVELSEFDDSEILDEYYERNLGGGAETWDEDKELNKAYLLHHNGEKDKAYEILWQYCLVKLNKIV